MKKTQEEQEMDAILRAQASNARMWQKQAQAGQEMEKWVQDGHYDFIQTRILAQIEMECFKKIKSIHLNAMAVSKVAKVQGTLEVFDILNARINAIIQTGRDALDCLKNLQDSTQTKEGE